jgi:hypothetical protein
MRRTCLALSLILATGAANAAQPKLPVPPIPPREPPSLEAPVPDLDARIPYADPARSRITLDSTINRRAPPNTSLGYGPGSQYQVDTDRRLLVVPGILLRFPFP